MSCSAHTFCLQFLRFGKHSKDVSTEGDVLTSLTISHSFWTGWYFVDPEEFKKLVVRVAWSAENLGLPRSIESSIGGNIVRMCIEVVSLWIEMVC